VSIRRNQEDLLPVRQRLHLQPRQSGKLVRKLVPTSDPSFDCSIANSVINDADNQASWNPNLLGTQPLSDSSDFDSSDSDDDSMPEAGPSSPRPVAVPTPARTKSRSPSPKVIVEAGPAPRLQPAVAVPVGTGGALKRASDGAAVTPRVEIRKKALVSRAGSCRGVTDI
jgi:hypothetical protein